MSLHIVSPTATQRSCEQGKSAFSLERPLERVETGCSEALFENGETRHNDVKGGIRRHKDDEKPMEGESLCEFDKADRLSTEFSDHSQDLCCGDLRRRWVRGK